MAYTHLNILVSACIVYRELSPLDRSFGWDIQRGLRCCHSVALSNAGPTVLLCKCKRAGVDCARTEPRQGSSLRAEAARRI